MKTQKQTDNKTYFHRVAVNRRARHDFLIEDSLEAGIELHGSEVKSLRSQTVDFADAYARIENGECRLIGLRLAPYKQARVQLPDPMRTRRLLLNAREIRRLWSATDREGRTLIPLEIYFRGSWAKVKLGICVGKKKGDKRSALREAAVKREMDRAVKSDRRNR
jgi:SsrA-binding protein